MAKSNVQQTLARALDATPAKALAKSKPVVVSVAPAVPPKARQIHKPGEVNISAYFPAEVKASLRMVQAKTGYSIKDCLAEALSDLFKKHNVPVAVELSRVNGHGNV